MEPTDAQRRLGWTRESLTAFVEEGRCVHGDDIAWLATQLTQAALAQCLAEAQARRG